jgi:rhodanese-related sulfurtransferase/DNA-binding transcriptional ArsR family regulator
MDAAIKREFKDQLFEQFARIGKSLANGRRLEILELLAQGPRTVEELAHETGLSVANASQHLQVLRRCNLVSVKRNGLYAHYKLTSDDVLQLCISLRRLGEKHLSDVQRLVENYLSSRQNLEPISCEDLIRGLKEKNVFVLDVRPRKEYEAGHIAGARSIPLAELKARLKEIPRKRDIVAYCRGPYCVFADEAVSVLASRGYRAVRLREGFPEWKSQRLAVEVGPDWRVSGRGNSE